MGKKNKKELCGVKFELKTALDSDQRTIIDNAAKKHEFKNIILLEGKNAFIVVFDSRVKREEFITDITLKLYGTIDFKPVNSIL